MYLIKLGGSVITEKSKPNTFKEETMDNLAKEIQKSKKEAIIVHGAGSFGHILAKKYNLNQGFSKQEQLHGFSETHAQVQILNNLVLKSLHKNSVHAVAISPHSILKLDNHNLVEMDYKVFEDYLCKKFTPVTYGDVVLDKKLSFSICSGDLLMEALAKHFKPEKVIFVMDEDGLYTSNPKKDKNAKLIKSTNVKELKTLSTEIDSHADVTKGMSGKLETIKNIAENGVDTVLLNGNKLNRLYHILVGKDAKCTIIHGE